MTSEKRTPVATPPNTNPHMLAAPQAEDEAPAKAAWKTLITVHARASASVRLASPANAWGGVAVSRVCLGQIDVTLPPLAAPTFGINYGDAFRLERTLNGRRTAGGVTPGQLAILTPDVATRWIFDRKGDIVLVSLSPDVLKEAIEDGPDRDPRLVDILPRFLVRDLVLERIAHQLLAEICAMGLGSRLPVETLAQELARHLLAAHSSLARRTPSRHAMAPGKLRRAEEFMRANLGREILLQELADAAGMSLYHFAKSFKQTTGSPPHRYLTEQRLRQARILLHDATLTIGDVARAVGLTHSHLTMLFARHLGMTPTAFREVLRS